jgi:hypothetical protein
MKETVLYCIGERQLRLHLQHPGLVCTGKKHIWKSHVCLLEIRKRGSEKTNRVGFSARRLKFAPRSVDVEFRIDREALGQVYLRVLSSCLVNIVPSLHRIHSCIIRGKNDVTISVRVPKRYILIPPHNKKALKKQKASSVLYFSSCFLSTFLFFIFSPFFPHFLPFISRHLS